jgi:cytochrome c oxidase cbb3-type subunit II
MNAGVMIFLGAFLTFVSAWLGLVFAPHQQLKDLQPQVVEETGAVNPRPYTGEELRGRQVYISMGCIYCHSQQVRGGRFNADLQRGWGPRRTAPHDYIHDVPALLGSMRTGPDLINAGARQPSRQWQLLHLYDPRFTSPGSLMPPFRFMFERRRIVGEPSPDALDLSSYVVMEVDSRDEALFTALRELGFVWIGDHDRRGVVGTLHPDRWEELETLEQVQNVRPYLAPGYELVPNDEVMALVSYLLSLDRTYTLEGVVLE